MGESLVASRIEDLEENLPSFIKLAYLPSYGKLRLRLSAKGENKQLLETSLDKEIQTLTSLIGDIIVGYEDGETIEKMLGKLLAEKDLTVATAESCTGGAIAKLVTSIPGSSAYFVGSIISYTRTVKEELLHVSSDVIDEFSVVSSEVAESMALGVQRKLKTDYAIATTGNAGPTKDKTDKTVGVVYIAIATPRGVYSEEFFFGKPRLKVIERAVNKSLEMLRKEIIKNS